MSIALEISRTTPTSTSAPQHRVRRSHASLRRPRRRRSPTLPTQPAPTASTPTRLRAIPEGTQARGFVLYVGVDEAKAEAAGIDLGELVVRAQKTYRPTRPDLRDLRGRCPGTTRRRRPRRRRRASRPAGSIRACASPRAGGSPRRSTATASWWICHASAFCWTMSRLR